MMCFCVIKQLRTDYQPVAATGLLYLVGNRNRETPAGVSGGTDTVRDFTRQEVEGPETGSGSPSYRVRRYESRQKA